MVKKLILAMFLLLILLPNVLATDVAYILRNPSSPESKIIDVFDSLDITYDLIDDDDIRTTDFSNYDSLLVWDSTLSNNEYIPVGEQNIIIANTYYLDEWNIAEYSVTQANNGRISLNKVVNNVITSSVGDSFFAYNTNGVVLYSLPRPFRRAPGIETIVVNEGVYEYPVIGIIDSGGKLYDGSYTDKRILFFGITETEYWSTESEELFKNSLSWALFGEDRDNDGYFSDEDCNDNDDQINPDAYDIPYDGIDQDCSGSDVVDIDEDGYNSSEVGGDDCNDFDEDINPGSTDVYMNCINDAPIIDDIDRITVYENDEAEIIVFAEDPEEDDLFYSINDSRFSQDENIFTWQTTYDDEGIHHFTVTVGDGELESDIIVEIKVNNKNQPPVCDEIPVVSWEEDGNTSINLSEYCYDPDGDFVGFGFHDSSGDTHISLDDLVDGVVSFSADEDFFGEDWIVFRVFDLIGGTSYTEPIILNVTPVDDEPEFSGDIGDIYWEEDMDLIDRIDLYDYFIDVDGDELIFNVSGNNNIEITIIDGLVSFYPDANWWGNETIIFEANDGITTVSSNPVYLEVSSENEAPEFGEINCQTNILEDETYNCTLTANDYENDTLTFYIEDEYDMNCDVNGNLLSYSGDDDYFGDAKCIVRVSDGTDYSEYNLDVNIENVNDAPVIEDYFPDNNPRLVEGEIQYFSLVSASDFDSDNLDIFWILDNITVGTSESYEFNESTGSYNLSVVVSDGDLEDTHSWTVFVGEISEFTCSEVGGDICTEDEICTGDILGVSDSDSCCSVTCSERPPEFSDIRSRCEELDDEIEINIKKPKKTSDYFLGEEISAEVEVLNKFNDDLDVDVTAYFYDLSEEDKISSEDLTYIIRDDEEKTFYYDFPVEDDLDDENEYALFVLVQGDNDDYEFCNEEYVEFNIERKEDNVVISDFDVNPISATCGEFVNLLVKVQNMGAEDQDDVKIRVESPDLGIDEKSEEFELERYDDDDSAFKEFSVKIPTDAEEDVYDIDAIVTYNGKSVTKTSELKIESCKEENVEITEIDEDSVKIQNSQPATMGKSDKIGPEAAMLLSIIIGASVIFAIVVILLLKLF